MKVATYDITLEEGWRARRHRIAVWVPGSLFSGSLNLLQLVMVIERYSLSTEKPGALNDSQQQNGKDFSQLTV